MPIRVTRDDVRRRLIWVPTEPLAVADWRSLLADQAESGLWTYATLIDACALRRMESLFHVSHLGGLIVALTSAYGTHGPIAVAVHEVQSVKDAGLFGLFDADLPFTFKLFTNLTDAASWLDSQAAVAML